VRELMSTNDPVLISAVEALLKGAGIDHLVADQNMSVLEGSIGIFPRRILVGEDKFQAAQALLRDAGFGHELRRDRR
jgi:putative signal transducing protein